MNEFYVIPNNKMILDYNLILPLESYSIGFDVYYSVSEINNLATTHNVSVIINKFLHKSIKKCKILFCRRLRSS